MWVAISKRISHGFTLIEQIWFFQFFETILLQLLEDACKLLSQQTNEISVKILVHPWLKLQGPLLAALAALCECMAKD
ncbi:hypothetical protein GWO43_12585 [candidate division KSB1 bacterium]|nr:hypothetical protein [candidate division KSB1 bacterium]NIR71262.1 hypothetical protein [candidate division KSB1 bacterium]NIS24791.1 hypothetical protein [candidate division KSB1 bacterium]NIT71698.1 hypothetical protein [candidate division KSB1 bacterium]NIU25427.1 hypothetical protein [candidate division KSB1 bacterium]